MAVPVPSHAGGNPQGPRVATGRFERLLLTWTAMRAAAYGALAGR